jgi:hypothetical protein
MLLEVEKMSLVSRWKTLGCGLLFAFLAVMVARDLTAQDQLTGEQTRQIRRIRSGIERAGRLYESKKAREAGELVQQMASDFEQLVRNGNEVLIAAAGPVHAMLVDARKALVESGLVLPPIADLPVPVDRSGTLTFSRDIAPILVSNCGGCHIDRARGKFSMASVGALAAGIGGAAVIVPGKPDESHLVAVIAEGKMPPSGNGVPAADLERIKKWIAAGAQSDVNDPGANLRNVVQASRPSNLPENAPPLEFATGRESVSFAVDIAPLLVENCVGCHFEAQNVRGGLSINNFRQLLRGGDSGPLVRPGDSSGSLLLQRLSATDNTRMPQGRPSLSQESIARIAKWIDEGARFDSRQPQMNLRQVSAIAKAERASHGQLSAERAAGDLLRWKKVMLDEVANQAITDDFQLIGTAGEATLKRIGQLAQSWTEEIRNRTGIDKDRPLVKGRISLFVFTRRYDFNEFGKMVEGRDMPADWKLHWDYDSVNAYVAIQLTDGEIGDQQPLLQQAIAAITLAASGADVPRWFSDGAGFMIAETLVNDKKTINGWKAAAMQAASEMRSPAGFINGQLSEDRAALVAYGFLSSLIGNRKQFLQIIRGLNTGASLDEVFQAMFHATPMNMVQPPEPGNGRRKR